jgi:UDP:flavonoid glycosyltransferase YjiC (YdhE family)
MRALFVTWNGGGNLAPALAVAGEVQRRGGSARVLGDPRQRRAVEAAGLPFEAFAEGMARDVTQPMGLRTGLLGLARAITDRGVSADLAASLARDPADVVVVDCMLLEALRSASSRGVATASLVHTFQCWLTGSFARGPFGLAARLRGASPLPVWATADVELVLTLPELDRPSDAELRSAHGPSPRLGPAWQGIARPTDADPHVLVSLSTTWLPGQDTVMQRILDAVDRLPLEVTVTTGPALDPAALRVPANTTVHRHLDHAQALPHASHMIGHGGHGTAMRALAHDVPLLIIPGSSFADQVAVGNALAAAGAARVLPRRAHVKAIRQAVEAMVDDGGHRAAAARLGAQIRQRDGSAAAVDTLEQLLTDRASAHRPPHGGRAT